MILIKEIRLRENYIHNGVKLKLSPYPLPHVYVQCDCCFKEWWQLEYRFITSRSCSLNNLEKKDYCNECRKKLPHQTLKKRGVVHYVKDTGFYEFKEDFCELL